MGAEWLQKCGVLWGAGPWLSFAGEEGEGERMCMERSLRPPSHPSPSCLMGQGLTPPGTHQFRQTGWPASLKGALALSFPGAGTAGAHRCWRSEFLRVYEKHYTNTAISQVPVYPVLADRGKP